MNRSILLAIVVLFATLMMVNCAVESANNITVEHQKQKARSAPKSMRAFRSKAELTSFFAEIAERRKRETVSERRRESAAARATATANMSSMSIAKESVSIDGQAAKSVADADSSESITNVQHAGVDEGGIVKAHGNHLVVLRRGRLFTVDINDLKPVAAIDAFDPDINPRGAWYDEMLIDGDTIAVIGYSYERGGTEIGLFNINRSGALRYLSTYHLRSNDYYSSRNYASRLVNNQLVFYTPLYLSPETTDPISNFPAIRKWHKRAKSLEFQTILAPTDVYRAERQLNSTYGLALHTVTRCDIASGELKCRATAVVGAPGRVFYVSPNAVYVWTTDWTSRFRRNGYNTNRAQAMLYRLPLWDFAPSAIGVSGSPVDQFSFLESEGDNHLNVLVRADASGDGMWKAEASSGDVALLRLELSNFADGASDAPANDYRDLPEPEGYSLQNRFIGDYVLYGTGNSWGAPRERARPRLYTARWASGEAITLPLLHGVDRIEAMGKDAIIAGADEKDLHFTPVRLDAQATVAGTYTRRNAAQGELRSHGFFYKPEDVSNGLLGLPVRGAGRPGYEHLFNESASVLFLRNQSLNLSELGELESRPEKSSDDGCRASCVDWYGNARPLFMRGRIFALMGYEIVEGSLDGGRIRETRRANFAPRRLNAGQRD